MAIRVDIVVVACLDRVEKVEEGCGLKSLDWAEIESFDLMLLIVVDRGYRKIKRCDGLLWRESKREEEEIWRSIRTVGSQGTVGLANRWPVPSAGWGSTDTIRVSEIGAGVRERAKASKKHYCEVCEISLQSAHALVRHELGKAHAEQVRIKAGGAPKPVSAIAQKARDFAATSKANKTYYCSDCTKAFGKD
ncbi:hypothetical protein QBC45DRAFT_489157 [Copromyces sp. CBS 386.78]|nr:hypothetical protein QBC45DRAFT_489157 [Copromyces sp. CBS 386.78]